MKILIVFTGGTIGSTTGTTNAASGPKTQIHLDSGKPYKLIDMYRSRYDKGFDPVKIEPVTLLSENSSGRSISAIVSAVNEHIEEGYDGIIVTHGTDTLQYTAAALGYCLGNNCPPVCLVSSDYPVEDPRANGLINLHNAVEFIRTRGDRGVWVIYRNRGEKVTQIHRATRLLAHQTCSSEVRSMYDTHFGIMDEHGSFTANPAYREIPDELEPFGEISLPRICRSVMRITSFPGMTYPDVPGDVKYIIHESYHSGTICTSSEIYRSFFDQMYARRIRIYLAGAIHEAAYESKEAFADMHIHPVPDLSPISLYMKLWIADSAGLNADSVIHSSLGADVIDQTV